MASFLEPGPRSAGSSQLSLRGNVGAARGLGKYWTAFNHARVLVGQYEQAFIAHFAVLSFDEPPAEAEGFHRGRGSDGGTECGMPRK